VVVVRADDGFLADALDADGGHDWWLEEAPRPGMAAFAVWSESFVFWVGPVFVEVVPICQHRDALRDL
jgi:hypothetical protein